jgi:hypothetical protein
VPSSFRIGWLRQRFHFAKEGERPPRAEVYKDCIDDAKLKRFASRQKSRRTHLKPSLGNLVVLNLVDANEIDLARPFPKGSRYRLMVNHDVPQTHPR